MAASRINHVSVHAHDLEASARFYEDVFGMERIATPRFPHVNVLWLQLGEQQLHLFEQSDDGPRAHHFGLDVDDFEAVYTRARELGVVGDGYNASVWEHPAGWVQMYLRDPSGNLVEIDWPDVTTIDRSIVTDIRKLDDAIEQSGDAAVATLYVTPSIVEGR
jgi:catechol 2,3-dioxygenase-like lactoylglutathione lyase family enzyme